ncbi:hypothetical protein BT67DRAFT_439677 [Trichocladium antarcticum]|uniref:Uncharacterized protein n=1 Tax=Trichocladium antarcticum TaxID=1450529 RepID=A0AAN6UP88_9PEZI|nr:hypothetical protein BT67DRAFT_439677 [Trichocladium antarcticum]
MYTGDRCPAPVALPSGPLARSGAISTAAAGDSLNNPLKPRIQPLTSDPHNK